MKLQMLKGKGGLQLKSVGEMLIKEAHDGRFGGHFAERRNYKQLRKFYWWDKMRANVRHYC